ncbi:U3 snoRNP protein [Kappamyces sp. JEL0829]|nr:U3 snoRNP protein [Kappamyces sp. JEL0829]
MTSATVEYHLEQMMPEILDLEERELFTAVELKKIMAKRRELEYLIHRMQPLKQDFVRYIQYECGLESLRKLRKKRLGLDKEEDNSTLSDHSIVRHIHQLYQRLLRRFPGDTALWVQYIDWSKKMGSTRTLGRSFANAIQSHPTKALFWILAAKWEWEDNGSITAARVLLQRGLRLNPQDQKLWLEYFKLELLWIEKLKQRRKVLFDQDLSIQNQINQELTKEPAPAVELDNIEGEETHQDIFSKDKILLESKQEGTAPMLAKELAPEQMSLVELLIPKLVLKNALKAIPNDAKFRIAFLDIYIEFGIDTRPARAEVYQGLLQDFGTNPAVLKVVCTQYIADHMPEDPEYPVCVDKCCEEFRTQLDRLAAPGPLYIAFADFLLQQLRTVTEDNLKTYLSLTLDSCFEQAHECGAASVGLYLEWFKKTKDADVLEKGLAAVPTSSMLWLEKIRCTPQNRKLDVLQEAAAQVGSNEQLGVWREYLDWSCQQQEPEQTDLVFTKCIGALSGWGEDEEIINRYLAWTNSTKGIVAFRKLVKSFTNAAYRQIGFHAKVLDIELECFKSKPSKEGLGHVNMAWEMVHDVDPTSIEFWMDHISFEMEQKNGEGAARVYWKACKAVKDVETLERRYQQVKNQ